MITPNSDIPRYRTNKPSRALDLASLTIDLTKLARPALIVCKQTIAAVREPTPLPAAFAMQTRVVETTGIEPMTPCLQSRCSPS